MTSKSIGVIHHLGASSVPSLATFKQRGQEILCGKHFLKDQLFDLDLLPRDLKINRGHLLHRGINCTKFSNFQAKGSKDIEWTPLCLQSDLFSKREEGIIMLLLLIYNNQENIHVYVHIDYLDVYNWLTIVFHLLVTSHVTCVFNRLFIRTYLTYGIDRQTTKHHNKATVTLTGYLVGFSMLYSLC